ncbi:MAG: MFS transporter, partial [Nitrososphaeraceae archaeon]
MVKPFMRFGVRTNFIASIQYRDFNITYGTAAWIFSAYLIVAAVMTPVAGRLSDLYGKKKVLLILLTIYIVGLVAGGFADNISVLLVT